MPERGRGGQIPSKFYEISRDWDFLEIDEHSDPTVAGVFSGMTPKWLAG